MPAAPYAILLNPFLVLLIRSLVFLKPLSAVTITMWLPYCGTQVSDSLESGRNERLNFPLPVIAMFLLLLHAIRS